MTIRSLSRIRARVERLTGEFVRGGCRVCREDEARPRYRWVRDVQAGGVGDEQDEDVPPESATCAQCGRTYALSYGILSWLPRPSPPAPRPV